MPFMSRRGVAMTSLVKTGLGMYRSFQLPAGVYYLFVFLVSSNHPREQSTNLECQ
jgi:hypothetical protein